MNFVIFRENTEGVYVGMGGTFKQGTPDEVAIQEDVNTRKGVERIVRAAFEYAQANGLERVTMSDKANAMESAGGLWRARVQAGGGRVPRHRDRGAVRGHAGDGPGAPPRALPT